MSKSTKDTFGYLGTEPTALREELDQLSVALGHLAKSEGAAAIDTASDAVRHIADRATSIANDLTGKADAVAAKGRNHVEHAIREQPLVAVSLAAAAGFLLAMLVRR